MLLLYQLFAPRAAYKKSKPLLDALIEYTFCEAEYRVRARTEEIKYSVLHRAYETKDAFYLFHNPRSAHIVDKHVLPADAAKELRALLQKQVKKYVVCQDA